MRRANVGRGCVILVKRVRQAGWRFVLHTGWSLLPMFVVLGMGTNVLKAQQAEEKADAGKPIFTEDFEQGLERWEIIDPESWQIEQHGRGNSLAIKQRESAYQPKVRSPLHIALVKELEVGSFEIEFQVKSTKDTGAHRDCCVFFGYQDPTHFYYVHFGAKPDPASGQIFVVNDAPRSPLTKNEKGFDWSDDWHTIKLRRDLESGLIEVYFDDLETPRLQVKDTTFGAGRVGIGSFDDMDAFDDIIIRVIE